MFAHYKRSDTNVIGYISSDWYRFEWALKSKAFACDQVRLKRFVCEDEFVLLTELSPTNEPTGRDVMMMVNMLVDDVAYFRLIDENPDVFWANQQTQEQ